MTFAHLHVHTNFSFKDSTCDIESLCKQAAQLGFTHLAMTDHNNLCGAIRFYQAARKYDIKPIIGVEVTLENGHHLTLLSKNRNGYSNLCRLLTEMHLQNDYGNPRCSMTTLTRFHADVICLSGCSKSEIYTLLNQGDYSKATTVALKYAEIFGEGNYYIEINNKLTPQSLTMLKSMATFADKLDLPLVATNNVHFIKQEDFHTRDVLVCMSENITLQQFHCNRHTNDQAFLKSAEEMKALFSDYPRAISNTTKIALMCNVEITLGEPHFPYYPIPKGYTAFSYLSELCNAYLMEKYCKNNAEAKQRLNYELATINALGFSEYFLVVWDIVNYARSQKIRFSGRGSAAGSIVTYLLGITHVCPIKHNLLFERFLNPKRKGLPDIDIDFDSARRDEIIKYLYNKYEQDKVAMVCTINTISARSSLREVGKVMGFSKREIDKLTRYMPHVSAKRIREAIHNLPELDNEVPEKEPWSNMLTVCEAIDETPRHLSVHLGGLVISATPLTDIVPLQKSAKGVIITQFDKDDLEELGLIKMDILALRMLSVIDQSAKLANINIDNISLDDTLTYKLLRTTKTTGTFQLESPGMRNLLGRLQPTRFDDIIANISLFRPGPMQADMIDPFIKRRHGKEEVTYLHQKLKPILEETYGVIIYQEQVLLIAKTIAGFTLGQADLLRRAMTHDRSPEEMSNLRKDFIEGALANNIPASMANKIFKQIAAFAAYGFNKAHAASFGLLSYQTAYLKTHHPAAFFVAILNNQPMGFYPPRVIINEARRWGIKILLPNVHKSFFHCTLEGKSIRLGFMYLHNLSYKATASIITARNKNAFFSCEDFIHRTQIPLALTEILIRLGAFKGLGSITTLLNEFYQIAHQKQSTPNNTGQLSLNIKPQSNSINTITEPCIQEKLIDELNYLSCCISAHPLEIFKDCLPFNIIKGEDLFFTKHDQQVWVAGIIVSRQTPPTRSKKRIIFITIEDETDVIELVIFANVQKKVSYSKIAMSANGLLVKGRIQRQGKRSITVIAEILYDLASLKNVDVKMQKSAWNEVPGGRSKIIPT